jgi:cyclopropane-fatty-acyl-phospholipid synthase
MTGAIDEKLVGKRVAPAPRPTAAGTLSPFMRRFAATNVPFEIIAHDGSTQRFGTGTPSFSIFVRNARGAKALASIDEGVIAEAYLAGAIDIEGDMLRPFELRKSMGDLHPLASAWRFLHPLLFGQVATNKTAIATHYDIDPEFFLSFFDPAVPCYTQGVFASPDEGLDVATFRKFDWCIKTCGFKPGDRFLEIGPGWGAFGEHGAKHGLKMTGITNSPYSKNYLDAKAKRIGADWDIVLTDFLEYQPKERFDGIVIMGVIEHLPDYAKVLDRFQRFVKPGGSIFLDGSAATKKYELSSFMVKYIYPGNHSFLVLHDFLDKVAKTPMKVMELHNDTESYFHTFRHWATNFDRNKEAVIRRFGDHNFRRFRLYLWGSAYEFLSGSLDCYRMVLRTPK